MKKSVIIVLGGVVFSTLFYQQFLGINLLLYTLFLTVALAISNHGMLKKPSILLSLFAMLSTATAVMMHGTAISVTMCLFSTMTFFGFIAHASSSMYVSWLNGMYNLIVGTFHNFLFQIPNEKTSDPKKVNAVQLTKLIIIPLCLVALFTALYQQVNPVFNDWLNHIDLSFIDALWVLTALLGSFIMSNVIKPNALQPLSTTDDLKTNDLEKNVPIAEKFEELKNEMQVGIYSLVALNVLLAVVLFSEYLFLYNLNDFKASALSQAVHYGVYASIVSIVVAIGLIAYYYRGALNFISNSKTLRILTYVWIGLNAVLIASIFTKNYLYISLHGLTYKRVGVMVYLLLCVAGLLTTYLKVHFKLNFTYLLRRNTAISYVVLCVFALLNWPAIITEYNINHGFENKQLFRSMLPQNALVLQENGLLQQTDYCVTGSGYMETKLSVFTDRNWQEFNLVAYQLKKLNYAQAKNIQPRK